MKKGHLRDGLSVALGWRQIRRPVMAWPSSVAVALRPVVPATEALADYSTRLASWRT